MIGGIQKESYTPPSQLKKVLELEIVDLGDYTYSLENLYGHSSPLVVCDDKFLVYIYGGGRRGTYEFSNSVLQFDCGKTFDMFLLR